MYLPATFDISMIEITGITREMSHISHFSLLFFWMTMHGPNSKVKNLSVVHTYDHG